MPRTDRMASQLIERSLELYRRRLWLHYKNSECFLLQVPTAEEPLVVSIMGQGGEDYGLVFTRGPDALQDMRTMLVQEPDDDFMEGIDWMGVSIGQFSDVPPQMRRVHELAGFQARREAKAPFFVCKPAHKMPRNPNRTEQKTLLFGINAALIAHDRDGLRPRCILESHHLLKISATGSPGSPEIETMYVRAAPPSVAPRLTPTIEVPGGLAELPRLETDWLIALPVLPTTIEGSDDTVRCLLVMDAKDERLLVTRMSMGGDVAGAASAILHAMSGENVLDVRGRPRTLRIESQELVEVLSGPLRELDVGCVRLGCDERLNGLTDSLRSSLLDGPPPQEPATGVTLSDLEQWKEIDLELTHRIVEAWDRSSLSRDRAEKRYFGQMPDLIREPEMREGADAAFTEWAVCGYRPTRRSRTLAEDKLRRGGLPTRRHRQLLEARANAAPSIHRVESTEPGESVTLLDVFSGRTIDVHDRSLSLSAPIGCFLAVKLYPAGPYVFAAIAGPVLSPLQVDRACDFLEARGFVSEPADAAHRSSHLFGLLWHWVTDHAEVRPKLVTAHGEPLEPMIGRFRLADPTATEAALRKRPDVDGEDDGTFRWLKPAPRGWGFDDVTAGNLQILGDELVVEVRSRARLDEVTDWLTGLDGVTCESVREVSLQEEAETLDDSLPPIPQDAIPSDVTALLEEHLRKHYRGWLDESIPALGGKTPRQACNTARGRKQVARLIRTIPASHGPGGARIEPPRRELLRELGLEGEAGE